MKREWWIETNEVDGENKTRTDWHKHFILKKLIQQKVKRLVSLSGEWMNEWVKRFDCLLWIYVKYGSSLVIPIKLASAARMCVTQNGCKKKTGVSRRNARHSIVSTNQHTACCNKYTHNTVVQSRWHSTSQTNRINHISTKYIHTVANIQTSEGILIEPRYCDITISPLIHRNWWERERKNVHTNTYKVKTP